MKILKIPKHQKMLVSSWYVDFQHHKSPIIKVIITIIPSTNFHSKMSVCVGLIDFTLIDFFPWINNLLDQKFKDKIFINSNFFSSFESSFLWFSCIGGLIPSLNVSLGIFTHLAEYLP